MNILISSYTLDLAGVPTFTLTLYLELVRRGHKVVIYSPFGGKLETEMQVIKNPEDIPKPDVILAQHTPCAVVLKDIFPDTPLLFYSHSIWVEIDQPPDFASHHYLAINEAVTDNLINKGVPKSKITIVRDFVDTARYASRNPLHSELKQVLFISNYKKWNNFKMIDAACKKLGVRLVCCGSPYGRNYRIEDEINNSDLVVSWGRGILEGMSCGRAVVSFEKMMGDGYITPENYLESRKDNFCGYLSKKVFTTPDDLASELSKYDPGCAQINRNLILKYHNVSNGVDQILKLLNKYEHT
jgi:hypothetical protein